MAPLIVATGLRLAQTPPPLTQEQQIRINLMALIYSVIFVAVVVVAIILLNRAAGKKRYARHQAKLAAEGRLGRSSALSDVANGPRARFDDDDAAPLQTGATKASVFGENYRPYGKDAIN